MIKTYLFQTIQLVLTLVLCNSFSDPTFQTSTFSTGNDGWNPSNWTTTDVNGLSPGNSYLNISADGVGQLGKMITFNSSPEWTGDYISAGVNGIELDIANRSTTDDVHLRIALGNRASPQQTGGTWFVSKVPVVINTQSSWSHVALSIAEDDLLVVGDINGIKGTATFNETLGDIQNIRILSAVIPVGAVGDEFFGDVGLDNVTLVPEPESIALLGVAAVMLILYRKQSFRRTHSKGRFQRYTERL